VTRSDLIDITVRIIHETEKAWLVDHGETTQCWIPKSRGEIEKNSDGKTYTLTIDQRLAEEKGMV
jgi:hypothetical protein